MSYDHRIDNPDDLARAVSRAIAESDVDSNIGVNASYTWVNKPSAVDFGKGQAFFVDLGESKIFSQLANTFTGEYPTQGFDFESAVSTFYAKLLSNQEPLGSKFEEVLHKNRWALYSRS